MPFDGGDLFEVVLNELGHPHRKVDLDVIAAVGQVSTGSQTDDLSKMPKSTRFCIFISIDKQTTTIMIKDEEYTYQPEVH